MAGIEEDRPHLFEQMTPDERKFDETFLKDKYPLDPMMVANPLLEVQNITMDPQLAFELQEAYEDIANRYLDLSAVLRTYAARQRRKAYLDSTRAAAETEGIKTSGSE